MEAMRPNGGWVRPSEAIRDANLADGDPIPEVPVVRRPAMTHAELDAKVLSLFSVGGVYEDVAQCVEHDNRPHCTGTPTGVVPPWLRKCVCAEPLREGDVLAPCPVHGWVGDA